MKPRDSIFLMLGLLSIGGVVLIVYFVGLSDTVGVIQEAGLPALGAMLLLMLTWLACQALAWDQLGRPVGHRVPFRTLFAATLIGFLGNFFTPSMYMGGEPLRVAYVGRRRNLPYYQVAGTVILAKYLEFIAFVLLMCVGAVVALVYYWEDLAALEWSWLRGVIGFGTGILVAVLAVLVVALRGRHHPLSAIVRVFIRLRILRRTLLPRRHRIREMEDQISTTFNRRQRRAWGAFVFLLCGFVAMGVRPLVFFYFLREGRSFTFHELCLLYVLTQFLLAFQITPGSLVTYEGGTIGMFAILDPPVPEKQALAFVMSLRLMEAGVLTIAMVLAVRQGIRVVRMAAGGKPLAADGSEAGAAERAPPPCDDVSPAVATADPPVPPPAGWPGPPAAPNPGRPPPVAH